MEETKTGRKRKERRGVREEPWTKWPRGKKTAWEPRDQEVIKSNDTGIAMLYRNQRISGKGSPNSGWRV